MALVPGVYRIQNKETGTFLDLLNGNSNPGTEINGWAGGTPTNEHQIWDVVPHENTGNWRILNRQTRSYITTPKGLSQGSDPTPLSIARVRGFTDPADPVALSVWHAEHNGDGTFTFRPDAYSDKVLGLEKNSPENRIPAVVAQSSDAIDRLWVLIRVE